MSENIKLGKEAEDFAVSFLEKKGYKILHRNWRFGHYELDIVCEKSKTLIIIEVKCRSGTYIEQPFQAVNRSKQRKIIEAANAYIEKYEIDLETRFDIISIISTEKKQISHIEDAFYPLLKK